jgi:uncharacterized protein YerC
MQQSQKPLNKNIENQLEKMFCGLLSETDSPEKIKIFFDDLLTEGERMAVLKRMGIAIYLDKKRSYEDIKNNIKVSSATIASVSEKMGNEGWQEMIKMIKAEEWASEWSDKLSGRIKKIFG